MTVTRSSTEALPVSVLIPAYNRARLLERALRSVNHQSRPADQVIVVDDASTDDTPQVAEALGAELIRHGRNLGASATYETGLRAVRNQWVALLDDDDEWLPHHLETLWSLTPGNVLVASSCVERMPGSMNHTYHGPLTREPIVLDSPSSLLHPENLIPSSAAMFHRDTAIAVGGFRAGLCEDLDLWCRLLGRGRATLSPRVGVLYHLHAGQVSRDWEEIHAAHLDVARSFAGEPWWSRSLVERRAGVTAWDRFRGRQRTGTAGAGRKLARDLLAHPLRTLGVVEVLRHRAAMRRHTSRLARSGRPSVAVLPGADPAAVPVQDRYDVDLSHAGSFRAFLRLARRPSGSAIVSSRPQAALVRLARTRPLRVTNGPVAQPNTNGATLEAAPRV